MINFLKYNRNIVFRASAIFSVTFVAAYMLGDIANRGETFITNVAHSEPLTIAQAQNTANAKEPSNNKLGTASPSDESYTVQAILGAKRQIVIASGIDAKITKFKLESGDRFRRGDVLIQYDCTVDRARLKEALSRQRVTEIQLNAYQKLASLDSASAIELTIARENNEQNKAMITQMRGRLQSCQHIAPWNGRVMRKMASQYEYVQTGRVLMEIASHDPLRAEFLIPSRWLRWLNVDTPLNINIGETDNNYAAKIVSIYGEVDPVSQSVQVVAEMEKYHEDLLPGMSGRADFSVDTSDNRAVKGFLGLNLDTHSAK